MQPAHGAMHPLFHGIPSDSVSRRRIRGGTCQACKTSKVKCDREKPTCGRCRRLHLTCQPQKLAPGRPAAQADLKEPFVPYGASALLAATRAIGDGACGLEASSSGPNPNHAPKDLPVASSSSISTALTSGPASVSSVFGPPTSSWSQLQMAASRLMDGAGMGGAPPTSHRHQHPPPPPPPPPQQQQQTRPSVQYDSALPEALLGLTGLKNVQLASPAAAAAAGGLTMMQHMTNGGAGTVAVPLTQPPMPASGCRSLGGFLTRFAALLVSGNVVDERARAVLLSWHIWNVQLGHDCTGGILSSLSTIMGIQLPSLSDLHAPPVTPIGSLKPDAHDPHSHIHAHAHNGDVSPHHLNGASVHAGQTPRVVEHTPIVEQNEVIAWVCAGWPPDGVSAMAMPALCTVAWSRGCMELECNERFACMYRPAEWVEEELRGGFTRPELMWESLISPADRNLYLDSLFHVCFTQRPKGAEVMQQMRCVDRWGLESPCRVCLRVYASPDGWYSGAMISILPLNVPSGLIHQPVR